MTGFDCKLTILDLFGSSLPGDPELDNRKRMDGWMHESHGNYLTYLPIISATTDLSRQYLYKFIWNFIIALAKHIVAEICF